MWWLSMGLVWPLQKLQKKPFPFHVGNGSISYLSRIYSKYVLDYLLNHNFLAANDVDTGR